MKTFKGFNSTSELNEEFQNPEVAQKAKELSKRIKSMCKDIDKYANRVAQGKSDSKQFNWADVETAQKVAYELKELQRFIGQ